MGSFKKELDVKKNRSNINIAFKFSFVFFFINL